MKTPLRYFFSIAVVAFFSLNIYAQEVPDTVSTAYGEGADVHISNDDKGDGDQNYSSLPYLVVRKHEVRVRIIYLKFDITDKNSFQNGHALHTYLGLNLKYSEKMAADNLELSVYGMIDDGYDDWLEADLTYNTAPGMLLADLDEYEMDYSMVEYLTKITVPKDTTGWLYSEQTSDMDRFINNSENDLLTFIILVELENENTGDEVRFFSKEEADSLAPILLGDAATGIESKSMNGYNLVQNYPNPFAGFTTLTYNLNEPEHVELTMYNVLGAKVATLVNEFQSTGEHNVDVDMNQLQLSPGIYYTKINVGSESQTIKMINSK